MPFFFRSVNAPGPFFTRYYAMIYYCSLLFLSGKGAKVGREHEEQTTHQPKQNKNVKMKQIKQQTESCPVLVPPVLSSCPSKVKNGE